MNVKKESISTLFVLIIVIISLIIMFVLTMGTEYLIKMKNFIWIFFLTGYFILLFLSEWLYKKFRHKIFKYLNDILLFPFAILLFLFNFTIPTIGLLSNIFYFLMICLIFPLSLLITNQYFNFTPINQQTTIFITLTLGTCISVSFYKQILNFVYRIGPFRIKNSEKMKKLKLDELTEYVLNKENIRFIIYTFFFLYLFVFSYQFLQDSSIFEIKEKDKAIYQSFLCFLAFDRILLNSKKFILLPSEFLKKITKSIAQSKKE